MTDHRLIVDRIRKKEIEAQSLEDKLKATKVYIQALKDVLAMPLERGSSPADQPLPESDASPFRPGTAIALAREAILQSGTPMHLDDLLRTAGKEPTREAKTSLGSALSAHVRKNEVFTRPAVSTFGLIELQHFSDPNAGPGEPPPGFGGYSRRNGSVLEHNET